MIEIDAATARRWIESGDARLVDVREDGEYAARHVPGALHVPLGRLSPQALAGGEGSKVVLLCASGMRSARGCAALRPKGVEAYSLKGGISAWAAAGGPTEVSPGAAQAAARQARLMAGFASVLGVALAVMVHPAFLVLAAIAGARLFTLLRTPAQTGCASAAPGQSSCATPSARGKGGGCAGCGAREG